ncbi:MAG: hypothetical protein IKN49_01020 [Elusimicrobiaceae bacterium]|nr:hypothetical protein [Elusimicrobiaceae bacterium]
MNRKLLILALITLFPLVGQAEEIKRGWELNLKRLAFELSSTDVKHGREYKDFPNAKLTADSGHIVKGDLDLEGNYFAQHFVWGNQLLVEYGKTTFKSYDGEETESENADTILLTSSYTQRAWRTENFLGGFEAGPYGALAYETEVNAQGDSHLKQVVRASAGIKIFEGTYIKDFHLAGFAEEDFTYRPASEKYGWEIGIEINQPVREGVTAVYKGLFRDYLYASHKRPTDLDYEVMAEARLDVEVWKELVIAPIIQYYTAQGSYVAKRGENLFVGVSLSFSHLFIKADEI